MSDPKNVNMSIEDVQRKKPSPSQKNRAKSKGFISGKMSANEQADQVSKMLFDEKHNLTKGSPKKKGY